MRIDTWKTIRLSKEQRYLGNFNTKEVHDLDNEKESCQIKEILDKGHERPYNSIEGAKADGFDPCAKCMEGSKQ